METIMVATDFSERSDRALRRATLLAKQSDAILHLVHVVDDDQPRRIVNSERGAAQKLLREQATALKSMDGIDCLTQVILAPPFAGIVQATEEIGPDLLVLGPHRRQALRDMFLGTTAERTIRAASCPTLMANAPPAGPYRHVLLSTDLSDGSRHAVESFLALGLGDRVNASLCYVFEAPALRLGMSHSMPKEDAEESIEDERGNAARQLSAFAASVGAGRMKQVVRYENTTPADEILAAAKEAGADLVVVGTRGRSGITKFLLGSVAEEVLRNADRDILAVPPKSIR